MIRALLAAAVFAAFSAAPALAQKQQPALTPTEPPSIVVTISVPKQELTVVVDGVETYVWPVSTAKQGALTPAGTFKVQSMNATAISRLFNDAPMPWAI